MASFTVHGPFKIEYEKRRGGRLLIFDEFWDQESDAYHNVVATCSQCATGALIRSTSVRPPGASNKKPSIRGTDTNTAAAAAITARELRLCTSSFTLPKEAGRTLSRSVPTIRFETGSFDVVGKGELRRS